MTLWLGLNLRFLVRGIGLRVHFLGFRVYPKRFGVYGFGFRLTGQGRGTEGLVLGIQWVCYHGSVELLHGFYKRYMGVSEN